MLLLTILGVTVESAKLFSWTLVLYGTEIDPLEVSWFYNRYGSNKVRNLKSRDRAVLHSPYLSSSIIKQLAVKGIIVPDINPANPKPTTPYYAPTFKPPTYKPANRPRFEYITEEVSGDTAASAGDNKVSDKKPIIYKHGDHHHWLGLWSSSHPQIRPSHTTSQPPGGGKLLFVVLSWCRLCTLLSCQVRSAGSSAHVLGLCCTCVLLRFVHCLCYVWFPYYFQYVVISFLFPFHFLVCCVAKDLC